MVLVQSFCRHWDNIRVRWWPKIFTEVATNMCFIGSMWAPTAKMKPFTNPLRKVRTVLTSNGDYNEF